MRTPRGDSKRHHPQTPVRLAVLGAGMLLTAAAVGGPASAQSATRQAIPVAPAPSTDTVVASDPIVKETTWGHHLVEFTVRNLGGQAVTAWEVTVECRYSDGSIRTLSTAVDGYHEYEGLAPVLGKMVPPHGTGRGGVLFPRKEGLTIGSTSLTVKWALFADGMGIGDAAGRDLMFREREEWLRVLVHVLEALEAGEAAGGGRAGLLTARGRLAVTGERLDLHPQMTLDQHPLTTTERRNLTQALEKVASGEWSADAFLAQSLDRVRREIESIRRHLRHQ